MKTNYSLYCGYSCTLQALVLTLIQEGMILTSEIFIILACLMSKGSPVNITHFKVIRGREGVRDEGH